MLAVLIIALFNRGDFGGPGLLLCSLLCVIFYRQRNRTVSITRWVGARLGLVAGIMAIGIMFFSQWSQLKPQLQQAATQGLQQALERSSDPAARQAFEDFVAHNPNSIFIIDVVIMTFVLLAISSLGGAIGASLMKRWRPQVNFISPDETKLDQPEKTEGSEHDR